MRISLVVEDLATDLAALGALGDEATATAARRLASAMQGPITARLLEALGRVSEELGASLPNYRVELRLSAGEAEIVATPELPAARPEEDQDDAEADARITLRLPARLKTRVEQASAREGLSVNTYIVRALGQQAQGGHKNPGRRRLTGYGRS